MKIKIKTVTPEKACNALLLFWDKYEKYFNQRELNFNAIVALKYLLTTPSTEINDMVVDVFQNNVEKNIITNEYFFKNDECYYKNNLISIKFLGKFKTKTSILNYIEQNILMFLLLKRFYYGSCNTES